MRKEEKIGAFKDIAENLKLTNRIGDLIDKAYEPDRKEWEDKVENSTYDDYFFGYMMGFARGYLMAMPDYFSEMLGTNPEFLNDAWDNYFKSRPNKPSKLKLTFPEAIEKYEKIRFDGWEKGVYASKVGEPSMPFIEIYDSSQSLFEVDCGHDNIFKMADVVKYYYDKRWEEYEN